MALNSTARPVYLFHLVVMVKYGIHLSLNVFVQLILFGMATDVLNVVEAKPLMVLVVSVLWECFGMELDVLLLIQDIVAEYSLVFGEMDSVNVRMALEKKEEIVFVKD